MSNERSDYVNEENLSLLPPTEHRGDYGGRSLLCGEYSSIGTAEIAGSAADSSNNRKREVRTVDADMIDSETFYQNPEQYQDFSDNLNNSGSDCGDSIARNGGFFGSYKKI